MKKKKRSYITMEVKDAAVKAASGDLETLVEQARPKNAPLHNYSGFIWDDAKAAHRDRINTAREIVQSVIEWRNIGTFQICARKWLHIPGGKRGYQPHEFVRENRSGSKDLLRQQFAIAIAAFTHARDLAVDLGLSSKVNNLLLRVEALVKEINKKAA